MFNQHQRLNSGSTLIEVLVAIVVVGLVVTGVMLSISFSIKNSAEAQYRETASQLAQDGMEIIKLRREVDPWSSFSGRSTGDYCLSSETNPALGSAVADGSNCSAVTKLNKPFTRYVEIASTPTIVTAAVVVEWSSDSNTAQHVRITQTFQERAI
ncbi:MAG: hypothetical protein COY81_05220 [Candidatus Pacebacteria bacterium CG_4_10_14_0_8_um_filter_43_12]|nr:MAG: hypothetical protein COY81_05220 [Candidatus Pacebacteria bacterium CG_4_10_14_0_8_um_filter_43_12]